MKIGKFEIIIAGALTLLVLWGAWCEGSFRDLSGQVVRLHVIANSNSEEDQRLKLQVRDAVLEAAQELTEGADSPETARSQLSAGLGDIEAAALSVVERAGYEYTVGSELGTEHYDTRVYEDFSLPEGDYVSLRVTIGAGEGKNWWCVVFPPLCTASVEEYEAVSAFDMDDDSVALITEKNGGYVLKFKTMELIGKLKEYFGW